MPDQIFFPIDIVMWIINILRKCCCGESNMCNVVCLGLRMLSHFISAIAEFVLLYINNTKYTWYDLYSAGLFVCIIILLGIMPFIYCHCFGHAGNNFRSGSWNFKIFSIIFDIFFISYTIYITRGLQGALGDLATLIVIDIVLEFTACFAMIIFFNCCNMCNVDNEVHPF